MTTLHIETLLTSLKLIKLGCFSSIITSISSKIKSVQMWIKIHANKINLGNARFFSGEVFSNKKAPSERNSNANCVFGLLPIFMLFVRKGTENWFQIFIHHCNICKNSKLGAFTTAWNIKNAFYSLLIPKCPPTPEGQSAWWRPSLWCSCVKLGWQVQLHLRRALFPEHF